MIKSHGVCVYALIWRWVAKLQHRTVGHFEDNLSRLSILEWNVDYLLYTKTLTWTLTFSVLTFSVLPFCWSSFHLPEMRDFVHVKKKHCPVCMLDSTKVGMILVCNIDWYLMVLSTIEYRSILSMYSHWYQYEQSTLMAYNMHTLVVPTTLHNLLPSAMQCGLSNW